MVLEDNYKDLPQSRMTLSGATAAFPVSEATIPDTQWTKIVDVPYSLNGKRINAVNIQLQDGGPIKINYEDPGAANWIGMLVQPGGERQYLIQPNSRLVIWAKPESGSGNALIAIEKLAG